MSDQGDGSASFYWSLSLAGWLLCLRGLSSVCVWGQWEEVGGVCSWGRCVAVPGRLLGAPQVWCCCIFKTEWQESESPSLEYFQLKKQSNTQSLALRSRWSAEGSGGESLQVWVSSWDPCRVLRGCELGRPSAQFSSCTCFFRGLESPLPKPPSTALPSVHCRTHLMGGFIPVLLQGLTHSLPPVCVGLL